MANLEVRCEVELLEMDYFDTREFTACGPPSALQLQVKWYGPIDSEKVSLEIAGMLTCLSEHEKAWGGAWVWW